ncbi:hypothetical protein C1H76_9443 [Elsinoe australis]|uniref:Thioesterase domain-containing protein n=1 Tax=Elsinoe australis TaxID=40998 RepID=A0A2P7YEQ1_9PEZI|nr:hypothetical protein B9Z65_8771 [Elsinoe australis]TKX18653.1 hypothetical protein C1H76_9443 [Elsinoe australis]
MGKLPKFDWSKYDLDSLQKLSPMEKAQLMWKNIAADDDRFFVPLFQKSMRLIDASSDGPAHGKLVFEFDNDDHWSNNSANLHGGAQATIYDICTSIVLSLIARPGFWMLGGVSRVLSVTYIRPAPVGETLILECEIVHAGKRLAVTKGTMKRKSDGAIVSTCEHNKVNTDPEVGAKM